VTLVSEDVIFCELSAFLINFSITYIPVGMYIQEYNSKEYFSLSDRQESYIKIIWSINNIYDKVGVIRLELNNSDGMGVIFMLRFFSPVRE
jgi:hypothetical protein